MNPNSLESEYADIVAKNAWTSVFQKIGRQCQAYPYTCVEAKKPQNKPLNRYRDVNPFDHSRIILKRSDQDYINANLVKMERANRKYILTQGPLAFTIGHFWLMIFEQDSRAILMLNKIIEKSEIKCHWYWPHGLGEEHKMTLVDVQLTVEQISEEDFNYYSTRVFKLQDLKTMEVREVIQYHYTTWPDFGVPTSPTAFLDFLTKVRASGALAPDVGPPVVHCSAGIGRSGTFCLVDSCLVIIENEGLDNINIQEVLLEMRRDRMGLIQTPDQLRFSYQAIIEGTRRLDPDFVEPDEPQPEQAPVQVPPLLPLPLQAQAVLALPVQAQAAVLPQPEQARAPALPQHQQDEAAALPRPEQDEAAALPQFMQDEAAALPEPDPENENIFELVDLPEEEEAPPPPPPRGASLRRPPARPLPAIPASASLGNLSFPANQEESSSSDEEPPTPPPRVSTSTASSADDEDDDPASVPAESGESMETLRRRVKSRELAERVSAMKRRARNAEKWHALKRLKSVEKPQTEPRQD